MSKSLSAQRGTVVTQPFCSRVVQALISGKNQILLAPATFPRVLAQADLYELYRFTKLRFRIATFQSSAAGLPDENILLAYFSGPIDSTPAFTDLNENVVSTLFAANMHVKTDWVQVPGQMLRGPATWYKGIAGTMESWDEVQGTFALGSTNTSSTGTVIVELEGTVEFTSPADPGATPAERARRHNERDRERILRLLASSSDNTSAPVRLPTGKTGKSL